MVKYGSKLGHDEDQLAAHEDKSNKQKVELVTVYSCSDTCQAWPFLHSCSDTCQAYDTCRFPHAGLGRSNAALSFGMLKINWPHTRMKAPSKKLELRVGGGRNVAGTRVNAAMVSGTRKDETIVVPTAPMDLRLHE